MAGVQCGEFAHCHLSVLHGSAIVVGLDGTPNPNGLKYASSRCTTALSRVLDILSKKEVVGYLTRNGRLQSAHLTFSECRIDSTFLR